MFSVKYKMKTSMYNIVQKSLHEIWYKKSGSLKTDRRKVKAVIICCFCSFQLPVISLHEL